MSVRIRKIARELDRTPAEVIGVLHALGHVKCRSADDLISDSVESDLRRGVARGVVPFHVDVDAPPAPPAAKQASDLAAVAAASDLMSRLVPGVVPQGARAGRRPAAPAPALVAPRPVAPRAAAPVADVTRAPVARVEPAREPVVDEVVQARAVDLERAQLASLRRTLESERTVLDAERAALAEASRRVEAREASFERHQFSLQELQTTLERERAALDAERAALTTRLGQATAVRTRRIEELLEARGLRGADEFERALVSLAQGKHLREVLWTLQVESPELLERLLSERLALVGTEPPEAVTRASAVVTVAPERAEVPDVAALGRMVAQVSDGLLLRGARRLVVVGGRPLWHRLVREHLDPRVEVRFFPARRGVAGARDDVAWADVVALWNADLEAPVRSAYESGRALLAWSDAGALAAFLTDLHATLVD